MGEEKASRATPPTAVAAPATARLLDLSPRTRYAIGSAKSGPVLPAAAETQAEKRPRDGDSAAQTGGTHAESVVFVASGSRNSAMLFSVWHQYCQPPPAPKRPFSAKRHARCCWGRTGAKQVPNRMPTAIFTHSALVLPPIVLSCSAADFRARTELSSSEAPAATTGA